MKWLWTWGGECFGYLDGDELWTHDGRHVGRLVGDELFRADGRYMGELKSEDRLITSIAKKNGRRHSPFAPHGRRSGYTKYANYVGLAMYAGYEDFPGPEQA
jgi:hypothetical protein